MQHKFRFILLVLIPVLFSCKKREVINSASRFFELEARLFDIPFPLEKSVLEYSESKIVFIANSTVDHVVSFYKENFDVLGWNLVSEFDQNLFWFEKPNKLLSLLVEQKDNRVQVSLFVKNK